MAATARLEAFLNSRQVPYRTRHHRVAYTAGEVARSEEIPQDRLAKAVMILAGDILLMVVVPASRRVDLQKVAECLRVPDARLAHEGEFAGRFPDCESGAVPAFGNLYQVPVCVDDRLAAQETIVVQAGTHTDTISLRYADYADLVQPVLGDLTHESVPYRADSTHAVPA